VVSDLVQLTPPNAEDRVAVYYVDTEECTESEQPVVSSSDSARGGMAVARPAGCVYLPIRNPRPVRSHLLVFVRLRRQTPPPRLRPPRWRSGQTDRRPALSCLPGQQVRGPFPVAPSANSGKCRAIDGRASSTLLRLGFRRTAACRYSRPA